MVLATVMCAVVGCGGSDDERAATSAATIATSAPPIESPPIESPPDEGAATTEIPSSTEPIPAESDGEVAELIDSEIVSTIALDRADLGFLTSDGEALWATGRDGAIIRIDPVSGAVDEFTVGDGLISGQLLPTVVDDSIWLSAIQGSHLVRLDRITLSADSPIEVPGLPGLVVAGPGDHLWVESTEPPAGLRSVDMTARTVGEVMTVSAEGEIVGSTSAFGALWLPLYDERALVKLDGSGTELERVPTGVGPAYVRDAAGWLWHPNWVDGTIARVDPATLDVTIVDLNTGGQAIERPSAISSTGDAIWSRAGQLIDGAAIVFRIDPETASVVGRRRLPGGRLIDHIGGMATLDDRLFVLDRPGRLLLELDTDQFLEDSPAPTATTVVAADPLQADVTDAVRQLLATSTTPSEMADGIVEGARLADQIAAFKQFFVDNLPGEEYEGDTLSVMIDGDRADIEFFIAVAGEAIGDPIRGTVVRRDDRWMLTADSFCRLVATGGIECPPDLAEPE
jgi:streptogramin lyase